MRGDKTAVQLEGDLLCPAFGPIPLYLLNQRFQHKVKCLWLTGWLNYQGWNVTVLVKRSTETLSDCGSIDTLAPITKHRLLPSPTGAILSLGVEGQRYPLFSPRSLF